MEKVIIYNKKSGLKIIIKTDSEKIVYGYKSQWLKIQSWFQNNSPRHNVNHQGENVKL